MSAGDPADPTDEELAEWFTQATLGQAMMRRFDHEDLMRLIRALQAARAERDVANGVACAEEQAHGDGPCGVCRTCLREQLATATAMVAQLRDAFHTAVVALHVHGMHRANFIDCDVKLCADAKAMIAGELESLATAHDAAVRRAALEEAAQLVEVDEDGALPGESERMVIATAIRRLMETSK